MVIAGPFETRIEKRRENNQILPFKFEFTRLWKVNKVEIIPIVISAIGMVTDRIETWILKTGIH